MAPPYGPAVQSDHEKYAVYIRVLILRPVMLVLQWANFIPDLALQKGQILILLCFFSNAAPVPAQHGPSNHQRQRMFMS